MSENEDAGSSVSDLEKDNEGNQNSDMKLLLKQRNVLEEQLKRQVQKMTPADEPTKTQTTMNAMNLAVPTKKKRANKGNETASDMSSAEESEDLNTDESTDATNDETEINGEKAKDLEDVMKERRPSNLVRINTQTKWSDDQLDSLQSELLDQMSQIAVQGGLGNAVHLMYPNFEKQLHSSQNMNDQSNHNFVPSNGIVPIEAAVDVQQTWPLQVHGAANNQEGVKTMPHISEREREMLAQIEFLKQQNAQLLAAKNVEIQTSPITSNKQKPTQAYHVDNKTQTNRLSSIPKKEIKEPLLESSDNSHSKTCKDICSCIIL